MFVFGNVTLVFPPNKINVCLYPKCWIAIVKIKSQEQYEESCRIRSPLPRASVIRFRSSNAANADGESQNVRLQD